MFLLLASHAALATIGDCGATDAPSAYSGATCRSVCVETGAEVVCELETLCPDAGDTGAEAWAVTFTPDHDVSMFGACLNTNTRFCCVFDEGADNVGIVEVNGTDDDDGILGLSFVDQGTRLGLEPWDDDPIQGVVRGNEGGDHLEGSVCTSEAYEDVLSGQHGVDVIFGFEGDDFLSGGTGGDALDGGDGDDTLWGGDGDDAQSGGPGADVLCDATGYNFCSTNHGNFMDGGSGRDTLWYDSSENPLVPCPGVLLDEASTAGRATQDQCGDRNNFTEAQLPRQCEVTVGTAPRQCEGAR